MDYKSLRELDIKYLWHPCTEISTFEEMDFPIIERAKGVYLYEVGGRPLLDGIASWWCVNLGHGHPLLIQAIQVQAGKLQHAILGGMSHPNAIKLAEQLARITPGDLSHSFFASDGASSVEAALKIAVQYWANLGEKNHAHFVGLDEGYHGDTMGAMGVGYVEAFHREYGEVVKPAYHALSPHCAQCPCGKEPETCDIECFVSMEQILREHNKEIAAVIVEPLCQAAAGIRIYPEEYLRRLRKLCDEYGLILIADEIAVGFGRTGSMFACERAGIVPDIMTVGKGITGGYMPLSAAIVTDRIYDSFRNTGDGRDRTFWHSHTFGGNPIITGLALAAIETYEKEHVLEKCQPRIKQLEQGMRRLGKMLGNSRVRTLGMMAVIEINDASGGAERANRIVRKAYEFGLFLRPRGRAIYLWPPLVISEPELDQMLSILEEAIIKTG
ncbi:MAG: adenosylmethionine--8-amino-7-oxononanoate transaminase [Chloroflexi bacterium RBG_16_51_9]|nr:MAG: adenosylmethionine--8-amino-7-oxononanoate transaminase [Chloroflexi bacterium RBG_16_51_9]